jgi:PAS domain S-box-containing protein
MKHAVVRPSEMADLASARAAYLRGEGAPAGVRPMVLASWERSVAYGVEPGYLRPQQPDPGALAAARERAAAVIEGAEPFLQLAAGALADEPHILALSDAEGRILDLRAGRGTPGDLEAANLFVGASWHEADIGCNGIGTALATGKPVILIGPEHFQETYIGWTCIGVPLRSPGGRVVGALDLSVPAEHTHVHSWGWVLSLAQGIELSLRRGAPAGAAEAELWTPEFEEPLQVVRGVFDLLAGRLDLAPTHQSLMDEARATLADAEARLAGALADARDSESRLRLALEAAQLGTWRIALRTGDVEWDARAGRIIGRPPGAPLQLGELLRVLHPDDRDSIQALYERVTSRAGKGRISTELRILLPDGGMRWIALRGQPVREPASSGGAPETLIGVVSDVTERKEAESALRRERHFLQRLVDAIPVFVTVYDPAIRSITVNREFERVLGWTNEDLQVVDVMAACYPDPACREEVRRFMQSLEGGWRDFVVRTKDGSDVATAWANIRLDDERQVGIGIDISVRKQAEEDVRRSWEAAQQAILERDNVLAVVSHDLRNPLSTIAMASALLLEDIPGHKKQAHASIIRRSVSQMTRLIQDLLDAARIEGGWLRLIPAPCSPEDLVRTAAESNESLALSRSLRLEVAACSASFVCADRDRILQVLNNLVANAIEHTAAGGLITLAAHPAGGETCFTVADTGTGIEPDHIPHVFDRYWQAGQSRRAGAGLGLSIARQIVEAHGGRIWVDTEPGQGATFCFTLPVHLQADAN